MNAASAHDLLPDELAALMYFYAESGVAWLSEDAPVDRFAEMAAQAASRSAPVAGTVRAPAQSARPSQPAAPPATLAAPVVAVPDAEAVEAARRLAGDAADAAGLVAAVEDFAACNLKFSAKHTVFASGSLSARIMVLGGIPAADDDREGRPLAGAAGQIFSRMMAGVGIETETLLVANLIPWRTPGDRAPTMREIDICRPFAQRLIELVRPAAVLVLGNIPVRILSDQPRAGIHAARGKWLELPGHDAAIRAYATFHPQEMLATPACKRLAWQDMLRFRSELAITPSGV
ncbi:MAG: uracil-DNA glycosylase [Rhizobium sp.]|nr:uracil-DNA glycosylase [Rhizobium sp.]